LDAALHPQFKNGGNVQVKDTTVLTAAALGRASQLRVLSGATELVIALSVATPSGGYLRPGGVDWWSSGGRLGDLSEFDAAYLVSQGRDDIAEDFYLPCMRRASEYDRAVAFFRSTVFPYCLAGPPRLCPARKVASAFFAPGSG